VSATLKLTHKAIGAEVRRGAYSVVLDGEPVGSVEMNDTFETALEPGVILCRSEVVESPAEPRTSSPPTAQRLLLDARERASCRSFLRPSSSPVWRSNSSVSRRSGPACVLWASACSGRQRDRQLLGGRRRSTGRSGTFRHPIWMMCKQSRGVKVAVEPDRGASLFACLASPRLRE
jgi:hypothetical protein